MKDTDAVAERLPEGFLEKLLTEVHAKGATHLHIEPEETGLRVRYRVDGKLRPGEPLPRELHAPLLAYVKGMSALDPNEQRLPQSGLFYLRTASIQLQCQVETIPGILGEKLSLWLRDTSRRVELPLAGLGMSREQLGHLHAALRQRSGLIVFTGPMWSGRNTTAYSSILELAPEGRSIASIEEYVRGRLPKVHQLELKEAIGLNYAAALRSILRSDHDVIYLREVVDMETLDLSLRAVLSQNRLLLTTLHTQDAASVVTRMEDMGIEPWLIIRALRLVQAQRLLRRLCPHCRREVKADASVLASAGLSPRSPLPPTLYAPYGCEHCEGLGYTGRVLVCETLPLTPTLQDLVLARASARDLKEAAIREGLKTLRVSGLERACEGLTSLDEVLLGTPPDRS
ncbi:GspE/PulE family protein [Archangium lansingense]|uniref:ATPase, T2SS/T4P/T4SS family n=1 Tax=Archangium lansingense TaxID=2995310 RepID=A0ABT4AFD6_9BACT|nr:ATPase, T2SS/T4P/T4SS family [Archangium lansinium]MCY1080397.1 ATPase, T2SS/T4P/T4SS family [Archangium lansinium]